MAVSALLLSAAWTPGTARTRSIALASYSVTRQAFARLIPSFCAGWERDHHERVRIYESYGSSGSQTRAVIDGLEADVVVLGIPPDMERLVAAGLVSPDWRRRAGAGGIVARSLIVFLVRKGNPRAIEDWPDLFRPGVRIIQAHPRSSGAARWVALAAYGAGGADALRDLLGNTIVFDKDARDASHTFVRKRVGDVLPTWESDALMAVRNGAPVEVVVPRRSILAELPVAVVDAQADARGTRDIGEALVAFLMTGEAQEVLAECGIRPVDPEVAARHGDLFAEPAGGSFTILDLGGWERMNHDLFGAEGLLDLLQDGPTAGGGGAAAAAPRRDLARGRR